MHKVYSQLIGFETKIFLSHSDYDLGQLLQIDSFTGDIIEIRTFGDGCCYGNGFGNGYSSYGNINGDFQMKINNVEDIPTKNFSFLNE